MLAFAMACSNTFGLVTGAFLLGFGLSEIPKSLWRNSEWSIRQKVLSHKIAKMAVRLDDAHQDLSNAIVVSILLFLISDWCEKLYKKLSIQSYCSLLFCKFVFLLVLTTG